ncbi:TetR/AcrR family transcriptional regulator [Paenibacillus sp. YPG26]|uniref:TetR/AcrR family transcriptional regulator n=1 Tax=Paenibacillus sp. YPG26 TaxID=2878915 RepID=UPI0020409152|nr:TetR/AcrR family transcriptional regulator [Paenibacillus sp. YPG26]USB33884.1 TetR/AcrR family transcriptional regulator [Paenibacillus sp. YPG26]
MKAKEQQILLTAQRLFYEHGIAAVSMEQIAEAVPVSKMTIYKYFGSKEGLLNKVIDHMIEEYNEDYKQIHEESKDTLDLLDKLMNYRKMDEISLTFVTELMEDYPKVASRISEYNQNYVVKSFEDALFRGQQMGQIRKDVSPHLLVQYLISMKQFLIQSAQLNEFTNMRTLTGQMLSLLYHGIIVDQPDKES